MRILYLIIFYWSYLVFVYFIYFFYRIINKNINFSIFEIIYFLLMILFFYARFIEPNLLFVKKTKIEVWFKANIVLLSDLHLWVYKWKNFLSRIIQKVKNLEDIDFILIPWDSIFYPKSKEELEKIFSNIKDIKIPIFAILWSHDFESKEVTNEDLLDIYNKYNIKVIDNEAITFIKNQITFLWLWDNHINRDKTELIKNHKEKENLIVLTHSPDAILKYDNNDIPVLTISGHTHWWQIRLPFIYKYIIPCKWRFDQWLYQYNWNKLFVSSWLGEVLLPMRLFIPPVIDVLELR